MRENRPYGSEGGASQTNGTSLPPIVGTPQAALIRRKLLTIGVGGTDYIPFPLPPNRTGGCSEYGSPFRGVPLATITGQVHINLAVLKVWLTVSPVAGS